MNANPLNHPIGDEEILAARIAERYKKGHSIFNRLTTIGEEVYKFEPRDISFPSSPGCRFSMVLPKSVQPLAPEYAKIKYPHENRPEVILSNDDTTVNFVFQCDLEAEGDLEYRHYECQAIFKHMNPSNVFFSENILKLENGLTVACFDYCGRALDDDIYYFYFLTDFPTTPQAEVLGAFSCPIDFREKWEPLFRQMVETIKPILGEDITHP